jgi:hypothetical protein
MNYILEVNLKIEKIPGFSRFFVVLAQNFLLRNYSRWGHTEGGRP